MAEDKPRLVRLASILTLLQSKRIITATDIAEKHGISIRTVYRDIRTLEATGIPIITEEGRGYSIIEGYTLPPVMFTEEEANAIITAEKIISRNNDKSLVEQYQKAITKIKSILRFSQKEKTELLSNRIQVRNKKTKNNKPSQYLVSFQKAITNYQVIDIDYLSLENKRSQRKIEPFAIFSTHENWVLVAFCQLKKDFRAFRLDHIIDMKQTGIQFEPHKITLSEYFEQCRQKGNYP
jgi:predicted DNA-binding transcriptional regulator YafY